MKGRLYILLLAIMAALAALAQQQQPDQRRVTPVTPSTNTVLTPPKGTSEEVIQQYISGDTMAIKRRQEKDSLRKVYPRYPLLAERTYGFNFADLAFMAFGQKYGSIGLSFTLNMKNRFFPTVEAGVGRAKTNPDDMNFTYKSRISPYLKLGLDYNFLFKNSPDYKLLLGLRFGASAFKYDINDVETQNGYWGEDIRFSIKDQSSHALWGELVAGLRVKLSGRVSMGWMAHYHRLFNYKKTENSSPWFIPGYGTRGHNMAFTLSVFYTIPMNKDKWPVDASKASVAKPSAAAPQSVPAQPVAVGNDAAQ